MLTRIVVRNVRVFSGDWSFDLKPLTVVCGTNSSGKSTLLKMPLLLRQSIEARIDSPIDGALRLNGPSADLGRFETLVAGRDQTATIGVGVEIADRMPLRTLNALRGRSVSATRPKRPRMSEYRLASYFEFQEARHALGGRVKGGTTPRGVPALVGATFEISARGKSLLQWRLSRSAVDVRDDDELAEFSLWFPRSYIKREAGRRPPLVGVTEGSEYRYSAHVMGILPWSMVGRRSSSSIRGGEGALAHASMPPVVEYVYGDLRVALRYLRYVGPLRAPARRYYTADRFDPAELDPTGEGVPYRLREQLARRITYTPPGTTKSRRGTLRAACDQWLHYLRTGETGAGATQELAITSVRDVAVEVRLRSTAADGLHALVDSGFGYSQVLPILAACLLADPGETILIEQPELHLNPSLVVRLADFFVAVMRSGRQVVVETHSEHLVNALRVLVAEDEGGLLHSRVSITYLDDHMGALRKIDLAVGEDGTVAEWPPKFFGEALHLSARLLAAQKRFLAPRN